MTTRQLQPRPPNMSSFWYALMLLMAFSSLVSMVSASSTPLLSRYDATKDDGKVRSYITQFDAAPMEYYYLDRAPDATDKDETIILRSDNGKAYVTHNQGLDWAEIPTEEEILVIYINDFYPDQVYLVAANNVVYYSTDRANTWNTFKTPAEPSRILSVFTFHPNQKDWILFSGEDCTSETFADFCKTKIYYTINNGKNWNELEDVSKCIYITDLPQIKDDKLIYCIRTRKDTDSRHYRELIYSNDYFQTSTSAFDKIVDFVQLKGFLVVGAISKDDNSMEAYTSVDAKNFAPAKFPHNFHVKSQQAYTLLDSSTNSIFLHVTVFDKIGSEYGSILKSNSNGTSYVLQVEAANRNEIGFVDFERMQGLEGVIIINEVSNVKEVNDGEPKTLKSKITHNDGSIWKYINAPLKDSEGKDYKCDVKNLKTCSLNLHGFTERRDFRDTFSSKSAIGMMMAVGNVGDRLGSIYDGDTFITKDGGLTWKEVKKGVYMWEYGDQGSIIVIVNGEDSTNTISYTLDDGDTWNDFQFSDNKISIFDIATVPSDNSRKFLLFGKLSVEDGSKSVTIQIDFTGLTNRKCILDVKHEDSDDFELWTPSHPSRDDNCLFGHESQYYRKIPSKNCYIGDLILQPKQIIRDCECVIEDFECDFNYYRTDDGQCSLVPGYEPPDHESQCKEMPDTIEYWIPTGYRRIPLTSCKGGKELDKVESKPCPGKEQQYANKHKGIHGFALFVIIIIPIGMAAVIGYIIYDNYVGKYGQIRLGEDDIFGSNGSPISRYASLGLSFFITAIAEISYGLKNFIENIIDRLAVLTGRSHVTYGGLTDADYQSDEEGELFSVPDDEDEDDIDEDADEFIV